MRKRKNGYGPLEVLSSMNISLKNFYESFRLFLNDSGKYILFTSMFYSLWLVHACVLGQHFDLHSFSGRMIGIATLEAYDVGARVSLFYKCIALLFCAFGVFNSIGFFTAKKSPSLLKSSEIKITNYSSIVGILFLLFRVFGYKISDTMELVYFIHKLMFGAVLLKYIFFKKNQLSIYNYTLIFLISVSTYFFIADCFNLSGQLKNPDFLITTFIICCILVIISSLIQKKSNINEQQVRLNSLAYILVPIAFLPFLSILKDEVFLVLKHNHITLQSPFLIYIFLIMTLLFVIYFRFKKSKWQAVPDQKKLAGNYYFPIAIFSLISFANYSHYINYSDEVFEAANKYLAIMEFDLYGVVPTIEKFNSHLLSDYFFSAIYTFLNGLGDEMQLYEFLYASISYVLYYYLVYYVSRNAFVAAFSILLFPLCSSMFPEQYAFGIFAIFALHKLFTQKQNTKKLPGFLSHDDLPRPLEN